MCSWLSWYRALTGWARRLVSCLGSPVQSQAGSLHLHQGAGVLEWGWWLLSFTETHEFWWSKILEGRQFKRCILFISLPHPPMLPHLESSSIPNSSTTLRNQDKTKEKVTEQYTPYHLGVFRRSAYRNVSYCNVSYPPFWTLLSLSSEATI